MNLSWLPIVVLLCFWVLSFLWVILKHRKYKLREKNIVDEFHYCYSFIERYETNIAEGIDFSDFQFEHNIPVKFFHYIQCNDLLLLFDRSDKLFAIYNFETNKTHSFTFKKALKIFNEFERVNCGNRIKPGDITINKIINK